MTKMNQETLSLLRQIFILFTNLLSSIAAGIGIAFPGVLIPAITSPNSTDITATREEASWIVSSMGFAGISGFLILPFILQIYGRRAVFAVSNMISLIGWIIIVFAPNAAVLCVGRVLQGIKIGGFVINIMIISEYVHPSRRGYFNSIKKIALSLGVLLCHILTLFCTWKQVAEAAIALNILSTLLTFFWPESPQFLAMKGRFEECEQSYIWLHGESSKDSKECKDLIKAQKESIRSKHEDRKRSKFVEVMKCLIEKDCRRAIFIQFLLLLLIECSGRHFFMVFIIQIMHEIVGNQTFAAYYSIGADIVIVIALLLSCMPIKYFNRRTLLFYSGGFATLLMFSMSLVMYLNTKFNIFGTSNWIMSALVIFYCFVLNIGTVPVCYTLLGEIFSLHHKGIGSFLIGVSKSCIYIVFMKYTPALTDLIHTEGVYVVLGFCMICCLSMLCKVLPETKDKPLLDIEIDMKGVKLVTVEQTVPMLK